jgi:hypothetical protein
MSARRGYAPGRTWALERVDSRPTTGGLAGTKIPRMPLFACSCVLISRPSRRTERRHTARLADEFFDSYLRWREASEDLRNAYQRWGSCSEPLERDFHFEAYRSALDREEHTAREHSRLAGLLPTHGG